MNAESLGIKYRSTNRFRGVIWDIIQNTNGTKIQRNEVIIIGLEQPFSSFGRVSVFPFVLIEIMNAKQGIMIVRKRIESL
jgi:hypothetical protein